MGENERHHDHRFESEERVQLRLLIKALDVRRAAHVAFIVATGARLGESLRARRADVDLARRVDLVRGTKTQASHDEVPITVLTERLVAWALAGRRGATNRSRRDDDDCWAEREAHDRSCAEWVTLDGSTVLQRVYVSVHPAPVTASVCTSTSFPVATMPAGKSAGHARVKGIVFPC